MVWNLILEYASVKTSILTFGNIHKAVNTILSHVVRKGRIHSSVEIVIIALYYS